MSPESHSVVTLSRIIGKQTDWEFEVMYRDGEESQMGKRVADDLTPYRRLIELQKEMIALSQKHEHSKRERDVLRKQIAREVGRIVRRRTSFSHRLRRSTAKFITRLPGFAFIPIALKAINPKPS